MNVLLYGKNAKQLTDIVRSNGLQLVEDRPDIIISYGGDGTLLSAERHYPGIPKLPIRDSAVCLKCEKHTNEQLIKALAEYTLTEHTYDKLEARIADQKLLALNDIVLRNKLPTHAIRFRVWKNEEGIDPLIIGDGIVATTAFGSSGYFHSITQTKFDKHFGLAFNNPTRRHKPLFFTFTDVISVTIIRGPATLSTDNSSTILSLTDNDTVAIKPSVQKAKILNYDTLRCPNCRVAHDKRLQTIP